MPPEDPAPSSPQKPPLLERFGPPGCAVVFVVGLSAVIFMTCETTGGVHDAGYAFFEDLREGRVDAAYRSLARSRRAQLDAAAFEALVESPVYREHTEAGLGDVEAWGGVGDEMACVSGGLERPEGEWHVQLYLEREGESWHVHSFAIDPPALIQRGRLLPMCHRR